MAFRITVIDSAGIKQRPYIAIGNRDNLLDAAYDAGALGVTLVAAQ